MMITGGTAFAQVLNMILSPVITRLYAPEEYGIVSLYSAILIALSFLGSMNYEMGIPIAEQEEKAINVLSLSIITLLFFTSLVTFIFIFVGDILLTLLNGEALIEYKYLIPVGIFVVGLYNIFTQWAYRRKNFKSITQTKISQSIFQNLISIGFGILGKGPVGLVLGRIFGQGSGITTLTYQVIKKDRDLLKKIRKQEILWAAKRYRNFPLFTAPRKFLGDISIAMPILFITSLYGSQAVGLFGLANTIIQLPMNLIGNSIGNVYYAESASLRRKSPEKIKELSDKLLKILIGVGLIPFLLLVFFGPALFSFIFGENWYEAGIYASLLSWSVFTRIIFKPISNIFEIFEKQKLAFKLNILRLVLVLISFGISSYLSLNSFWAVGLYSLAMSIIYFLQYVLAQKILHDEIKLFQKA